MGTTALYLLPYPEPSEAADVPVDMRELAEGVEGALLAAVVTSLPSSPVNGQVIHYLADATLGIVWQLRYRQASSSAYKWEFIGGGPLSGTIDGSWTLSTGTATDPALSTLIPLAGDYAVGYGVTANHSAGTLTVGVGQASSLIDMFIDTLAYTPISREARLTLVASAALKIFATMGSATGALYRRWLRATPIRVG